MASGASADRPGTDEALATFLYDDCCPLCRTYTATLSALGWADRAPFSTIDGNTLEALDMNRARHHIPLVDQATGQTKYGLDGILDVVGDHVPRLAAVGRQRHVRWGLDQMYHFITYNRRHIISAPPPATGIDCAPDYEPKQIKNYLAFCSLVTGLAGRAAPLPVAMAAVAATALVVNRDPAWKMQPLEAAGHAATVTTAAAGAAALASAATGNPTIAAVATACIAARKLHLRRWIRKQSA